MSEVSGINIDGEELVNVQVGGTLFRDGGPYGDQSDAIRDEKINSAREGREPNFDTLIPTQYKLAPKEEVRSLPAVESQRKVYEQETIFLPVEADYTKPVKDKKAQTLKLSTSDEAQADSENVARAALTNSTPVTEADETDPNDPFDGK